MLKILIIEDEKINRLTLEQVLKKNGHTVVATDNGIHGIELIGSESFDVVLSDLRLPGSSGMEILEQVRQNAPGTETIIMTAFATVKNAVECLKKGAYDYLTKPFQVDEILHLLKRIKEVKTLNRENEALKRRLADKQEFPEIVGESDEIRTVLEKVSLAAPGDHTVLIQGESGTGKELIADAVQRLSSRRDKPYIKVNCSALSETLFESEMFGHEKGAFTGALQKNVGRFERADGGTIFLDDIDDLSRRMQTKLLRAIQSREIERVGGTRVIPVDIRIIAATKADLRELVEEGKFREDFYYRLHVAKIMITPLRERRSDIPVLIRHFLSLFGCTKTFSPDSLPILKRYHWPGNVRELKHFVEQLTIFSGGPAITIADLPEYIKKPSPRAEFPDAFNARLPLDELLSQVEISSIRNAMEKFDQNQKKAADFLGIPRTTLRSKLERYQHHPVRKPQE